MTDGQALALAQNDCTACFGLGMVPGRCNRKRPCGCVWRAVFRKCYDRFRMIHTGECYVSTGTYQIREMKAECKPADRRQRINEEYSADFYLLAKRTLARSNPLGWKLFRFHYLLGAPWQMCAPRLGLDRGQFWHEVYRIQQALGKAFAETEPYGLYPTDEYFGGTIRKARTVSARSLPSTTPADRAEGKCAPLRAPLAKAA